MIRNIRNVWSLIVPYWKSDEKGKAALILFLIIALTLGEVYITVLLNQWNAMFYNALQNLDKDGFIAALFRFMWLALTIVALVVYKNYLIQMLQIRWRRWLTGFFLNRWLGHQTHYRIHLLINPPDNPDQRVSEDTGQFIDLTVSLTLGLISSSITLFSFLFILWDLSGTLVIPLGSLGSLTIPGYMVWAAVAYAFVGTFFTSLLGKPLMRLNFEKQRMEADFRFSLVRFRENSEPIAFYKGEAREKKGFGVLFVDIFQNFHQIMKRQKTLTWFTAGYFQAATVFPFLVAFPRFFAREIQLGGLMQTASAFGQVQGSLSYIINSYTSIAIWKATVERLTSFNVNIDNAEMLAKQSGVAKSRDPEGEFLRASNMEVRLPNGRVLQKDINLEISAGRSILINGPSGCGKSTLLRTLAGLWPFASGELVLPGRSRVLFLPQNPYLPLGSLRDALCYPTPGDEVEEDKIREALRLCHLDYLGERLNDRNNWSYILSPGERQRIAFARAIINKPDFIFLDEATSAVDDILEVSLYNMLKQQFPNLAIVSVGHRHGLLALHEERIVLEAALRRETA